MAADRDETVAINVDIDTGTSVPDLRLVREELSGTGSTAEKQAPKIAVLEHEIDELGDTAKRTAAYQALAEKRMKSYGNEALKTAAKVSVLERIINRMNRATNIGGGGAGGKGGKKGGGSFSGKVAGGTIISLLTKYGSIAAIVASLIPALVSGAESLVAGVFGLAGALAPLGGLLVAYPGYLAAVMQGFIAVKLAVAGAGDALKVYSDRSKTAQEVNAAVFEFAGSRRGSGREFIRTLSLGNQEIKQMGYGLKQVLLPSLTDFVNTGRSYLPLVSRELNNTGYAVSDIVGTLRGYLGQGSTRSLIGTILGNNVGIIRQAGPALTSIADIVLKLVSAGGPMLRRITTDLTGFFSKADKFVSGSDLPGFFSSTYAVLKKVMAIVLPLGESLIDIMRIGKPLGDALLDTWGGLAQKLQDYVNSEKGVREITQWFQRMTPVLYELGYLVSDISKALLSLSDNDGFIRLSATLRTELLPVLVNLIDGASKGLLPVLVSVVTYVLEIVAAWQQMSFLTTLLKSIMGFLEGIAKLTLMWNGALLKVGAVILALWAAFRVGGFVIGLFNTIQAAMVRMATAATYATGAERAMTAATYGLGISIKSLLISTGIGALVVALGFLFDAIMSANSATEDAVSKNKQWAESLFDVNGQLVDNNRLLAFQQIKADGTIDLLKKVGISTDRYIDALMGNKSAYDDITTSLQDYIDKQRADVAAKNGRIGAMNDTSKAATELIARLMGAAGAVKTAGENAREAAGYNNHFERGLLDSAMAAERLNTALQILNGLLDEREAKRNYVKGLMDLRKSLKQNGGNFDITTVKGQANQAALDNVVNNAMTRANKALEAGNRPKALRILRGLTTDIDTQFKNIFGAEKGKQMADDALGPVLTKIQEIKSELRTLSQLDWSNFFTTSGRYDGSQVPTQANPFASGKGDKNRWMGGPTKAGVAYTVGELGPERFIDKHGNMSVIGAHGPERKMFQSSGYVVPAHEVAKADAMAGTAARAPQRQQGGDIVTYDVKFAEGAIVTGEGATVDDIADGIEKGLTNFERNRKERG